MSLVRSHTFLVAKLHSNGGERRPLVPVPTLSFFSTRRPSRIVIVAAAQPHKLCLITESTNNLLRRSPTLRHGTPWTLSTPLSSLHASLLRTPCRALLQQGVSASCVGRWPPGLRVDPLLLYQDVRSYSARFLCNEACAPTQNTKIHSQGEGQGNVEPLIIR